MLYTTTLFVTLWGFAYTRPGRSHMFVEQIGYPRDSTLLGARQTVISDVPSQCESICGPPNTVIANICIPQTCCTPTFEEEYFNCLVCFGDAINLSNFSSFQQALDSLQEQCAADGHAISTLILPGQGSSSSLSSATSGPTGMVPATTSIKSSGASSASFSSQTSPLPTPSMPILPSTMMQQTVTTDARTAAPSTSATVGNGAPTMGVLMSYVWAAVIVLMTVAMKNI